MDGIWHRGDELAQELRRDQLVGFELKLGQSVFTLTRVMKTL